MKKINVIDLDNTLIPFDSFRFLVLEEIKRLNVIVIILTVFRKLRIIKLANYKCLIINALKLDENVDSLELISEKIVQSINKIIMEKAKQHCNENTLNILCSASPEVYVKIVAQKLGWVGYGSHFVEKQFYHMYGANKVEFIKTKYPTKDYNYNFAISDSESDLGLLKLFDKYELIQ